jgi:abortive infection bacteriophage resistance protein
MVKYQKPFKSVEEQLVLIEGRGLSIVDPNYARAGLERLGYYRLSAYWYPFRVRSAHHREGIDIPSHMLHPGHALDDIIRICDFDSLLRNLILAAISQVEVAVRVAIAYETGKRDPFAYLDKDYWGERANALSPADENRIQYEVFCDKHRELVSRSKEAFAKHFREIYDGELPIWAAIELWDFGTLSRFYQVMQPDDRANVATRLGITSGRTLQGWIEALNDLRNFCAHHQRLNRRHFPVAPSMKGFSIFRHVRESGNRTLKERDQDLHRLYPLMCVLTFLHRDVPMMPRWREMTIELFESVPRIAGLRLSDYGIPENWTLQELWQE